MSFETISLVMNWTEVGALLAILFRLGQIFELIANTQRELRRAIHHLGERRSTEGGINDGLGGRATAAVFRSLHERDDSENTPTPEDLAHASQ